MQIAATLSPCNNKLKQHLKKRKRKSTVGGILSRGFCPGLAWDSSITKKANREIKSALFQFMKTVNRKV